MLHELRIYDLQAGKAMHYLELFRHEGVQYVTRHLPMIGYWLTDTGELNRLYHLWMYESLEERAECRAGLAADKDWNQLFVPRGFPLIRQQRNSLMRLVWCDESLSKAKDTRRATRPADSPGSPVFSKNTYSIGFSNEKPREQQETLVAHWQVLSGHALNEHVCLHRNLPVGDLSSSFHTLERLQALTCSPLD